MKKIYLLLLGAALMMPGRLEAQNTPLMESDGSIPSVVERIVAQRDSISGISRNFRHIKSHINLEFASSANAYFTEGHFDECSFKINRVRLEIYGRLNPSLSYHFRQSFNKYSNPYSLDNVSSSVEYANITWHQSDRFELVAGKQFVSLGGYEYYVNALRVREFSDFNNSVACYQTGLSGVLHLSENHELVLQAVNNRSGSDSDLFVYGRPEGIAAAAFPLLGTVNWNGLFADGTVQLRYAASAGQLAKERNIWYLTCGNIYEKGPVVAYLDAMYSREGIDSQGRLTSLQKTGAGYVPVTAQNVEYLTLIANFDYSFHPKWNAYLKGVYETASVYKENGIFVKGRYMTSWNAQACLEWFPFSQDKGFKVFAHYLYKGHSLAENAKALGAVMPHTQRLSLGVVYVIPVL